MNPIVTRLNRVPGGVMPVVNVNQYDKSEGALRFEIYDGSTPFALSGHSAMVMGTKPDRTGFFYPATISGTNIVTANLTQQMTAIAGDVTCEVRIYKNNVIQGTLNFILRVEPAALAYDVVISETDMSMLEQVIELSTQISATVAQAEATVAQAEAAVDEARAEVNKLKNTHKQFLHSFANSGWTYNNSGAWSGYYSKSKTISNVYNESGEVSARGSSLTTPPSDAVRDAVSNMFFEVDDSAKTLTAYTKKMPTVTIYVSVEGVQ